MDYLFYFFYSPPKLNQKLMTFTDSKFIGTTQFSEKKVLINTHLRHQQQYVFEKNTFTSYTILAQLHYQIEPKNMYVQQVYSEVF